ncbi:MAG: hypothetical protein H0U50_06085 [Pyrinomonadaceae bacterium]|nr:hypothetical protein [Pyrinomonadaceae bacterium]
MKKHILGLGIFSFIFASFAFAFAFFYVPPIPQIGEVVEKTEAEQSIKKFEKTSCFRKRTKELSSEVVSSQLLLNDQEIVSEIKLLWNGAGEVPEKVIVNMMFSSPENSGYTSLGPHEVFLKPFDGSNEQTFVIVSRLLGDEKFTKRKNFYVVSSVLDHTAYITNAKTGASISERKEVLTVHGDSSITKK